MALLIGAACRPPGPKLTEVAPAAPLPAPAWVVDPGEPGPSLPPRGRSLFDFAVASADPTGSGRVPFPLAALVRVLEAPSPAAGVPTRRVRRVLVPRGRSLQRDAAGDAFLRFPRAVVAVDEDGGSDPARPWLADRLYLGYQESAAILEVISYNEAAGRFEFQVVRDYREGGAARAAYANRTLCVACHQNGAPIFARPLWDETSGSAAVAALLLAEGRDFYGIPAQPGIDVAYDLDAATDRANLFSTWLHLWSAGCGDGEGGRECRALLLTAALRTALTGVAEPTAELSTALAPRWRQRWPHGLALPTADIPNRNPLQRAPPPGGPPPSRHGRDRAEAAFAELVRLTPVPALLEPLRLREPLEVLDFTAGEAVPARLVRGLAGFLSGADLHRLDEALAARAGEAGEAHELPCAIDASAAREGVERVEFRCGAAADGAALGAEGLVDLSGAGVLRGSLGPLMQAGRPRSSPFEVTGGRRVRKGHWWRAELRIEQRGSRLRPRVAAGARITRLSLEWPARGGEGEGRLVVETTDDFAALRRASSSWAAVPPAAGQDDVLAAGPFPRASLLAALGSALGLPAQARCCEDARALPPPLEDDPEGRRRPAAAAAGGGRLALFHRYCGACHDTADRFPPNFLHGPPAAVTARLAQCGPRIAFRLSMWSREPAHREKTPMPPLSALPGLGLSAEEWRGHGDLAALRDLAAGEGRGGAPAEALGSGPYEALPPCLEP